MKTYQTGCENVCEVWGLSIAKEMEISGSKKLPQAIHNDHKNKMLRSQQAIRCYLQLPHKWRTANGKPLHHLPATQIKCSINLIRHDTSNISLCTSYEMTWTKTQQLVLHRRLLLDHCLVIVIFVLTMCNTVKAICLDKIIQLSTKDMNTNSHKIFK